MTKVSFFGAAGEVTGSNFLIETDSAKYVVDCGLFQGRDTISELNDDPFAYNPEEIDAVIITHAHLDHIGRLPKLVREGFRGPIYATQATIELTTIVLKDALDLSVERSERENKPPLYEQADLNRTLTMFQAVEYRKGKALNNGDSVTLYDAGHILGSASVSLTAGGKTIVFSGDVGHAPNPLLEAPDSPPKADMVVVEGTYGGEKHKILADRLDTLEKALDWTSRNNGVLLIPAFSIERTQELLFLFHELYDKRRLPKLPIFLDSPLAIEALEIFKKHLELFGKPAREEERRGHDVFDFHGLSLAASVNESKEINDQPHPKVIIAGSGMMAGGRIVHHLKHYLSRPDTYLLVIGFQAPGTLGSRIVGGAKVVHIMHQEIAVKAKVEVAEAFSGHADSVELIKWMQGIEMGGDGRISIVHSEPERAERFQIQLKEHFSNSSIVIPKIGASVEL